MLKRKGKGLFGKFFFWFFVLLIFLAAFAALYFKFFFSKVPLFVSPVVMDGKNKDKNIETLFTNAKISFSSISIYQDYYLVAMEEGGEVFISTRKTIDNQISSLQQLLKQLTIEGKRFKRIDFRFDKPIVTFR